MTRDRIVFPECEGHVSRDGGTRAAQGRRDLFGRFRPNFSGVHCPRASRSTCWREVPLIELHHSNWRSIVRRNTRRFLRAGRILSVLASDQAPWRWPLWNLRYADCVTLILYFGARRPDDSDLTQKGNWKSRSTIIWPFEGTSEACMQEAHRKMKKRERNLPLSKHSFLRN